MSKTKKENTTIKIKADSRIAAEALFGYFQQFSTEIAGQIKHAIGRMGHGTSDPIFEKIEPSKLSCEFRIKPTDKGDVFILDELNLLSVCSYTELNNHDIYGFLDGGKAVVFERVTSEGEFDRPLSGVANVSQLVQILREAPEIIKKERENAELRVANEKKKIEAKYEQSKDEVKMEVVSE